MELESGYRGLSARGVAASSESTSTSEPDPPAETKDAKRATSENIEVYIQINKVTGIKQSTHNSRWYAWDPLEHSIGIEV